MITSSGGYADSQVMSPRPRCPRRSESSNFQKSPRSRQPHGFTEGNPHGESSPEVHLEIFELRYDDNQAQRTREDHGAAGSTGDGTNIGIERVIDTPNGTALQKELFHSLNGLPDGISVGGEQSLQIVSGSGEQSLQIVSGSGEQSLQTHVSGNQWGEIPTYGNTDDWDFSQKFLQPPDNHGGAIAKCWILLTYQNQRCIFVHGSHQNPEGWICPRISTAQL